ncbi:glycosyltransferase family 9 protein [bacterium]|nr:glycosyltransferase family 9 protein [bacterium]
MSRNAPYSTVVIQLARLGDLAQSWRLLSRLIRNNGPDKTALVVDSRLSSLAGLMVGKENVLPIEISDLPQRFATGSLSGDWQEATRLKQSLTEFAADTVINLNYHLPAAAICAAIPAVNRYGARWHDVKAGVPSDSQIEQLFRATTGLRHNNRHLSDIWSEYDVADRNVRPPPLDIYSSIPLQDGLIESGRRIMAVNRRGLTAGDSPVGLIIGSGLSARSLPVSDLAQIVSAVSAINPVILIGSQQDAPAAVDVLKHCNLLDVPQDVNTLRNGMNRAVSVCGLTDDLATLAGVLKCCKLVVGVDTGALHLTAALGVRCLGIYYGSMHFRETGPYGADNWVITPDDPDYPCHEREMEAHPERYSGVIPPGIIVATLMRMLENKEVEQSSPTIFQEANVKLYRSCLTADGLEWQSEWGNKTISTIAKEDRAPYLSL